MLPEFFVAVRERVQPVALLSPVEMGTAPPDLIT
jgi:hypothetical protein